MSTPSDKAARSRAKNFGFVSQNRVIAYQKAIGFYAFIPID
jgi:hypothetical protein